MQQSSPSYEAPIANIFIVRHGETDFNRNAIIQGQQDTPLNSKGEEQARILASALRNRLFELALSSDLSRARKTAELILEHHPQVKLYLMDGLRERNLGSFQGRHVSEAKHIMNSDPMVESWQALQARAMQWWKREILDRVEIESLAGREEPLGILVVTHGGFITALHRSLVQSRMIKFAQGVSMQKCPNTGVTIIAVGGTGKATVIQYGDISHLANASLSSNVDEVEE